MAYTEETLSTAVYEAMRLRGMAVAPSAIPRIRTMIPAALALLADVVAASSRHEDMQKDFDATPVAGVVDLTALTGILFNVGRSSVRVAATHLRLKPVDSLLTLEDAGLPTDAVCYAQDGRTLRIRSTTPLLTDYVTPLKIRANYIPSLTDASRPLPEQFEGALVETLVAMVTARPENRLMEVA